MVKGVIFDVDGTLLDSMIIWADAGKRYIEGLGYEVKENLDEILFELTLPEGAKFLKEKYGLKQSIKEICDEINRQTYEFYAKEAKPKKGVEVFLKYLYKNNIPMTIATSTDRQMIEVAIKRLGWEKYFLKIYTTSEFGKGKDQPDIFIDAMEVMGTEKENTWLFEDGAYSMKTGKGLGLKVVGVYDYFSHNNQDKVKELSDIYMIDWTNCDELIKAINE